MATRVTDQTTSIIDLVVTDLLNLKYNLDIDHLTFSDHKLIFLNIDFKGTNPPKVITKDSRTNYYGIVKDIKNSDISDINNIDELLCLLKIIHSENKTISKKSKTKNYKK